LKLADFGSGMVLGSQEKFDESTTLWYCSPEVLMKTKKFSTSSDIWSVGCIFGEIIARKPLFKGNSSSEQISLILEVIECNGKVEKSINEKDNFHNKSSKDKKNLKDLLPGLSTYGKDLISKMLIFEEEKRITLDEALRHPYFEDLHDSEDEPISENVFKSPKIDIDNIENYRSIFQKEIQGSFPKT